MKILFGAIISLCILTGCDDQKHIGDALGPPGAKVTKALGDDWYVIELESRLFLYKYSKSSGETQIVPWPEIR